MKATMFQNSIEDKLKQLPILSSKTYFQFTSIVFFLMGIMLMIVCLVYNIHPLHLQVFESPVHYLVMGFMMFVMYLGKLYK